jgi:hypothetical protein
MIIRVLEKDINLFRPKQEGEGVLGAKYPYLGVIDDLMYPANNTKPDIVFTINCLAKYCAAPTMRHCNDIKNIL